MAGGKHLRPQRKRKKKTMDRILTVLGIALALYTAADLVVFYRTGSEPATLTGCLFGLATAEGGIMGWIRTNKDKSAGGESDENQLETEADQQKILGGGGGGGDGTDGSVRGQ